MEYEQSKFTKEEIIEVLAKFTGLKPVKVAALVELLVKLEIIPEYMFIEVKERG